MKEIKISDSLDNIEPIEINNIEIGDNVKNKISVDRVKKIVFEKIGENLNSLKVYRERNKINGKKVAVILAAAVLIISASVYAMDNYGVLERYFPGITEKVKDDIQDVSAKVEKNGVVLTVEAAISDGKEAIISYNMTKKDGSAFDDSIEAAEIVLKGLPEGWGYSGSMGLTDDNKKLTGYINPKVKIENDKNLNDYNLTLSVTDLTTRKKIEEAAKLNLKQIIDSVKDEPVKLIPEIVPGFAVEKAEINDGKVKIECNYTYESMAGIENNAKRTRILRTAPQIIGLKNVKTGEIINPDNDSNGTSKPSFSIKEGTDLSDLKPIIRYYKENIVAAGTWEVPIKLKASDSITKDVDITYILADKKMILKRVTVTELGVYLNGYFENYDGTQIGIDFSKRAYINDVLDRVYLVYNNGQILHLTGDYNETNKSKYGNMEANFIYSNLEIGEKRTDGNNVVKSRRTFIDLDEISSVIVKNVAIPLK